MFSLNQGDTYFENVISKNENDSTLAASCVQDKKTGDLILKLVNGGEETKTMGVNLNIFGKIVANAQMDVLVASADSENTFDKPAAIKPLQSQFKASKTFEYKAPPMSLTVIRIKTRS
jgi:alpha-L-arabinofuranosidase